jgi:hopanoid C-3 methylase
MKVLLVRPYSRHDRFGLAPFFRVEPLGLEYLGEATRRHGHEPTIIDERFGNSAARWIKRMRPRLVGITALHALEYEQVVKTAETVKNVLPEAFVVAGGPAAACYSLPLETPALDAVCIDDGEAVIPVLVEAIAHQKPLSEIPGLRLRSGEEWFSTPSPSEKTGLDSVPLPARDLVQRYRKGYHCLQLRPVWLIETARGCPFRCKFCSVWQLYHRSVRERSIGAVVEDFASTGENVFIVDDLFWHRAERSHELAEALKKRGIYKHWILVQSRTDLVARHADLLRSWRPLAKYFDIFFGFEAPTDAALESVAKDATVSHTLEAARIARALNYGITGNFLVDPDWEEEDFQRLWDFVSRHGFERAGYTILTPLPGTELFQDLALTLEGQPWHKYDMSHLLWEPRLGVRRFFELYAETWRRSVLNTAGQKKLTQWLKEVQLTQIPHIIAIMRRTQRLMDVNAYLAEHTPAVVPGCTVRSAHASKGNSGPQERLPADRVILS